jgi:hypothetical protein
MPRKNKKPEVMAPPLHRRKKSNEIMVLDVQGK